MKIIPLTQGKTALVDDGDFEWLSQWKWHYGNGRAARKSSRLFGKEKNIMMHRVITGVSDGMQVDHINHDTLDNRRENLRIVTPSQNGMNRGVYSSNKLGVKGVTRHGSGFRAQVVVGGKLVYQKAFRTLQEAKDAYEREAQKYHGEYFHP